MYTVHLCERVYYSKSNLQIVVFLQKFLLKAAIWNTHSQAFSIENISVNVLLGPRTEMHWSRFEQK